MNRTTTTSAPPLGGVIAAFAAIYVIWGSTYLGIRYAVETIPPVSPNAQSQELRDYFSAVLPEHDRDRVHINDIKKCLKWFLFMREKGIFEEAIREAEAEAEKAKAETAPETKEETN